VRDRSHFDTRRSDFVAILQGDTRGLDEETSKKMAEENAGTSQRLPNRLVVVEQEGNFVVANEDDPNDWVACFSHDARFPARGWAERMAELYNLRPDNESERDPNDAPLFTGTHHPTRRHSDARK
jgi:hypothetical protein